MSIVAHPTTPIVNNQAFRLGSLDAQLSEVCVPEMYYRHLDDKRDYCRGYAATAGPTLTTRFFLSDEELVAETDAYADDILDREYHARGGW